MSSPTSESFDLSTLGWDAFRDAGFADYAAAGLIPARVSRVDRGRCDVHTSLGLFRAATPAVVSEEGGVVTGDWAALRLDGTPQLVAVLPRRGAIYRASSDRTSRRQALVANVDTVVVATALTAKLRPSKVERLMALAWDEGATPVVLLTKADLFDGDPAVAAADFAAQVPGVEVLQVSSITGDGLDALREQLRGTTVVLGASGVGKSTLVNAIVGADRMDTGAVRSADDKGRHTTVNRELIPFPGGVLIDTPGLRGIGLQDADEGIERVYADIEALAAQCRFADCQHRSEPGCVVRAAIDDDELDADRLDRYERMLRESQWAASRGNARAERERQEQWKTVTRQQRAKYQLRERNRKR